MSLSVGELQKPCKGGASDNLLSHHMEKPALNEGNTDEHRNKIKKSELISSLSQEILFNSRQPKLSLYHLHYTVFLKKAEMMKVEMMKFCHYTCYLKIYLHQISKHQNQLNFLFSLQQLIIIIPHLVCFTFDP